MAKLTDEQYIDKLHGRIDDRDDQIKSLKAENAALKQRDELSKAFFAVFEEWYYKEEGFWDYVVPAWEAWAGEEK